MPNKRELLRAEQSDCYCGDPDGNNCIICDAEEGCYKWYHIHCEGLTVYEIGDIDQYACTGCLKAGLGETTYKGYNPGAEIPESDSDGVDDYQQPSAQHHKRKRASKTGLKIRLAKRFRQSAAQPENDDEEVLEAGLPDFVNGKPVPQDPTLSRYKQITDKLSVITELELSYNSANEIGDMVAFDLSNPQHLEEMERRVSTICERHKAIHAQKGAMKVMELDDAELAIIRQNPQAVKEFLESRYNSLVDIQNGDVNDVINTLERAGALLDDRTLPLDVDNLFGPFPSEESGSTQPQS